MIDNNACRPINVLLVEDDAGDVELIRETLKDSKVLVNINVVINGEQALSYLRHEEPYQQSLRPDLILCDLNMPKMDGRQLLQIIKKDEDISNIPVIILTTSDSETDIVKSYGLGANCYVTKPLDLKQFSLMVNTIEHFWFSLVKLVPKL